MKCPACESEMRITNREGVEIDYCPQCRGVWLDRGELEKIVARTSSEYDDYDSHHDDEHHGERGRERYGDHDDEHHGEGRRERYGDHDERKYHGRRREGFWGNIMDIFD